MTTRPRPRLAVEISEDVDDRLRLLAAVRKTGMGKLTDELLAGVLPSRSELASQVQASGDSQSAVTA